MAKKKLKSTKKINRSLLFSFIVFMIFAIGALYLILNKGNINGHSLVEVSQEAVKKAAEKDIVMEVSCDKEYLATPTKNEEGETAQMKVLWDGEPTTEEVTFKSSDESIVTVDENGVIQAVDMGIATVTAQRSDKKGEVEVTVIQPIDSMTLTITSKSIRVGHELQLKLVTSPIGASMDTVTWESDNTDIAVVSSNGICTGVNPGTATITVRDSYTGLEKSVDVIIRAS